MARGDGIRRNIAYVDPAERALLRDGLIELNHRFFPGNRADTPASGGVSWWFKQDEIHQATHVHDGPEFLPWHREIVNRLEELLRQINPQLSLHYWDWTQDPRAILNANLGGGQTGTLNLFTPDFMGYGGSTSRPIGEPWLSAHYYVPGASPDRDSSGNPADPPAAVNRFVSGSPLAPGRETAILNAGDYAAMRGDLESAHNDMHGFINMGGTHISFRDPFVFLLHSNVDRLFARWQTDSAHPERLDANAVYGSESNLDVLVNGQIQNVNHNIEPWSTGHSFAFGQEHFTRPWYAPENQGIRKTYKHPSIVLPPHYDTNQPVIVEDTVTVASWASGRLDVFARGLDNALWHIWYDGDWGSWESLGGVITSGPAAVSWASGRLDVFARGTDNALWHIWYDGGWGSWESLGGVLNSGPTVASWASGRLDVFARGLDNALWHIWYDGGWGSWESLGGVITSGPAAVSWASSRLDVFARGLDNALWHIWYDGGWGSWESLGGILNSGPAAASWASGRLDVFARGLDNALWHIWYDGGWGSWESLGGVITSGPGAVSWASGRLDVFARGLDHALWHIWYDGGWGSWESLGGLL